MLIDWAKTKWQHMFSIKSIKSTITMRHNLRSACLYWRYEIDGHQYLTRPYKPNLGLDRDLLTSHNGVHLVPYQASTWPFLCPYHAYQGVTWPYLLLFHSPWAWIFSCFWLIFKKRPYLPSNAVRMSSLPRPLIIQIIHRFIDWQTKFQSCLPIFFFLSGTVCLIGFVPRKKLFEKFP